MNYSNFSVPPPFSHAPPGAPYPDCHCPELVLPPSDLSCVKYSWPQKMITVAFAGAVFGVVVCVIVLSLRKQPLQIQKLKKFSFMKSVRENPEEEDAAENSV